MNIIDSNQLNNELETVFNYDYYYPLWNLKVILNILNILSK